MDSEPICDAEQLELLRLAREKGQKLLDELLKHQSELEANPPDLPPDQLEQGRQAMQNAIGSAKRMLDNLDAATRIAAVDNN